MGYDIGRLLLRGLEKRGWTQADLHREMESRGDKVPDGLVNHWIKGRRPLSLRRGLLVAELLGIDPRKLASQVRKGAA